MARKILTCVFIVLLYAAVGCRPIDSGASQLLPTTIKNAPVVKPVGAGEADLVEQMTDYREAYRNALKSLVSFYDKGGNNMKFRWAKDELARLDSLPQYNYIVEATVAPENLRGTASITEADLMYNVAYRTEKDAGFLPIIKNENKLRSALNMYSELIRKFPTSNKISDAAFRAAGISEYFRDYTIAVVYYKRCYQWDAGTAQPARFKAAEILDRYLSRMDEALELYKQSLSVENLNEDQRQFANTRIAELTQREKKVD